MKQKMIHILMKNSMMIKDAVFDLTNYTSHNRQGLVSWNDMRIENDDVFLHIVIQMKKDEILNATLSRLHIVCIDDDGRMRFTPTNIEGKLRGY